MKFHVDIDLKRMPDEVELPTYYTVPINVRLSEAKRNLEITIKRLTHINNHANIKK